MPRSRKCLGLSLSTSLSRLGHKIESLDLGKSGEVSISVSSQTGSETSRSRTSTSRLHPCSWLLSSSKHRITAATYGLRFSNSLSGSIEESWPELPQTTAALTNLSVIWYGHGISVHGTAVFVRNKWVQYKEVCVCGDLATGRTPETISIADRPSYSDSLPKGCCSARA